MPYSCSMDKIEQPPRDLTEAEEAKAREIVDRFELRKRGAIGRDAAHAGPGVEFAADVAPACHAASAWAAPGR